VHDSNVFLRARAYLVLGALCKVVGEEFHSAALTYLNSTVQAVTSDPSELVQVSCIRALQDFLRGLPSTVTKQAQTAVITALQGYISSHDLQGLTDSDDLKVTLVETLRDAIMIDTSTILDGPAIDLLFTLASNGASNFQLAMLVTESFESIVGSIATLGHEPYVRLCAKTIPSLTGAFDVANMTQESALTNLAAGLVSALVEFGSEPLPDGFVAAVMPKLNRVLNEAVDPELVRPATLAVQHMLAHGGAQFLAWHDATGKGAIEITLTIINRLLNSPEVDDNAAAEVGGLASELVKQAGSDKLGPYLLQMLQAVATRLASAEKAHFIQSLVMVFANLCVSAPKEVLDFLSQITINGENGLNVIISKWLENSITFAGYTEIRQNIIALSNLFSLQDPRLKQVGVKGDLIVQPTTRIKTRSQARANPDTYMTISAELKILKILVEELSSASSNRYADPAAAAAALDSDGSANDDDEWEDVGVSGTLDLATGLSKSQLMGFNEEDDSPTNSRARDDETVDYLIGWFRAESQKPTFQEMYGLLTDEEKEKLQRVGGS
jgi:importin-9